MKSTLTSKLAIGVLGLALAPAATQANLITGGIQITGGKVTADNADLTAATELQFSNDRGTAVTWSLATPGNGAAHVNSATGSFAVPGVLNQFVTMYSPLTISPLTLPGGALWTVGGFSQNLTSLEILGAATDYDMGVTALLLSGDGVLSGNGYEGTTGHWEAEIDGDLATGDLVAFGWSASSDSTGTKAPDSVPDGGATAILLGSALTIMGVVGRKQLNKA